jgi:hypothetical protein
LHVHEIFTESKIEKSDEISPSSVKGFRTMQSSAPSRSKGNPSDLYRGLIKDALDVNGGSRVVQRPRPSAESSGQDEQDLQDAAELAAQIETVRLRFRKREPSASNPSGKRYPAGFM